MTTLPKAIFFDWDGTLVDSYKFLEAAHNFCRQSLGLEPFQGEEFKEYFGHPREKLYAEIYGVDKIEQAKGFFEQYVSKYHVEHLKPMPGAGELVAAIHDLGIDMGVISNKRAQFLHQEMRAWGWEKYFKVVLGSGDAPKDKPAADPLIKAVQETGHSMETVWYVGDTDVDLQCAQNADCAAVFMAHDSRSDEWAKLYKPLLIFKNCDLFREFLLQTAGDKLKAIQA